MQNCVTSTAVIVSVRGSHLPHLHAFVDLVAQFLVALDDDANEAAKNHSFVGKNGADVAAGEEAAKFFVVHFEEGDAHPMRIDLEEAVACKMNETRVGLTVRRVFGDLQRRIVNGRRRDDEIIGSIS